MRSALATAARAAGLRRHHIAAARMRGEREILASVAHRRPQREYRILCYHGVGTPAWGVNDLSSERFAAQLELALRLGYRFVSLDEAVQTRLPKSLAVTFDDGLMSVSENAAPILRAFGVPFTVFVVSDWADGTHRFGDGVVMGWEDLRHLADMGASIGSHSLSHPNFSRISPVEARRQLHQSRETIASRLGVTPSAFAIPFGRSSDWTPVAEDLAAQAGYTVIVAQSENARPPGTIPRTFVAQSDGRRTFRAALEGAFDSWEEWA